jgi:hypothetical protein
MDESQPLFWACPNCEWFLRGDAADLINLKRERRDHEAECASPVVYGSRKYQRAVAAAS